MTKKRLKRKELRYPHTDKEWQNCAGYALDLEDWVEFDEDYTADTIVFELIRDYNLRQISKIEEAPKDSVVILFRIGRVGYWKDFHFVKYFTKTKRAYDKAGSLPIKRISTKNLFTEPWDSRGGREKAYNEEIYLFVKE